MKRARLQILIVSMLLLLASAVRAAAAPDGAAASVAIIFSRGIEGTSCGNAFFVGDGTLLVTARNVVFPRRPMGLHQGEAFVTALSPHLGDAAEVRVVAENRELELVLLRGPWRGHPALRIAEQADLVAAEKLLLAAYTNEQSAVAAGRPALLREPPQIAHATLDINAVLVRQNETRTITTFSAPPGPGWGGGPMLLPGTNDVAAGCYVRTQGDGSGGVSVACGAIQRLIEEANASAVIAPAGQTLAANADAGKATLEYLRGVSASAANDSPAALASFQGFLKLRPASAVGWRDAAGQLRALDRFAESQEHYARALEIDPSLLSARVLYGQLLNERMLPRAAEEHLLHAWTQGGGSTAAVVPLCNLMREQGREKECVALLDEALKGRPMDAHLWAYLAQGRRAAADHSGAAAAFARAADLMPDNAPARLEAAEEFASAGERARAEEQFRALVLQHPGLAAGHFHYARFIARDSARRDEALKEAEQALALADRPGSPPRAVIQSLISAIRAGRTSDASEFRL